MSVLQIHSDNLPTGPQREEVGINEGRNGTKGEMHRSTCGLGCRPQGPSSRGRLRIGGNSPSYLLHIPSPGHISS